MTKFYIVAASFFWFVLDVLPNLKNILFFIGQDVEQQTSRFEVEEEWKY